MTVIKYIPQVKSVTPLGCSILLTEGYVERTQSIGYADRCNLIIALNMGSPYQQWLHIFQVFTS
jgi:hypothetical protein